MTKAIKGPNGDITTCGNNMGQIVNQGCNTCAGMTVIDICVSGNECSCQAGQVVAVCDVSCQRCESCEGYCQKTDQYISTYAGGKFSFKDSGEPLYKLAYDSDGEITQESEIIDVDYWNSFITYINKAANAINTELDNMSEKTNAQLKTYIGTKIKNYDPETGKDISQDPSESADRKEKYNGKDAKSLDSNNKLNYVYITQADVLAAKIPNWTDLPLKKMGDKITATDFNILKNAIGKFKYYDQFAAKDNVINPQTVAEAGITNEPSIIANTYNSTAVGARKYEGTSVTANKFNKVVDWFNDNAKVPKEIPCRQKSDVCVKCQYKMS